MTTKPTKRERILSQIEEARSDLSSAQYALEEAEELLEDSCDVEFSQEQRDLFRDELQLMYDEVCFGPCSGKTKEERYKLLLEKLYHKGVQINPKDLA